MMKLINHFCGCENCILNLYNFKSHLDYVCFPESDFQKITFQTFLYLFDIKKVGQRKILSDQRKI